MTRRPLVLVPDGRTRRGGPIRVVALMAAVALAVALAVAGCTGDATVAPPTIPTGPDLDAGLGDPLLVPEVPAADLADHPAIAAAWAPDGSVWAIGAASAASPGPGAGAWHGRLGEPGVWYPLGSVTDVAVGADGRAWVVAGTALTTFDGHDWRRVLGPTGSAWSGLSSPAVAPDGSVWALDAAEEGHSLAHYDGRPHAVPIPVADCTAPTRLAIDGDGSLWTSGFNGWLPQVGTVCEADDGDWTPVEPLGHPAPATVLARDLDGSVWAWLADLEGGWQPDGSAQPVTVATRGLARLADGRAELTAAADLPRVDAWSMAAGGGMVWLVASGQAGPDRVWRFDGTDFSRVDVRDAAGVTVVPRAVLVAESDGSAWIAGQDGRLVHLAASPA